MNQKNRKKREIYEEKYNIVQILIIHTSDYVQKWISHKREKRFRALLHRIRAGSPLTFHR